VDGVAVQIRMPEISSKGVSGQLAAKSGKATSRQVSWWGMLYRFRQGWRQLLGIGRGQVPQRQAEASMALRATAS
jgi:hypothetical protein